MKARAARVRVTDHAVLRWLEREHGVPVEVIRSALGRAAQAGAELQASAVQIGRVKLVLVDDGTVADGPCRVVVTTCLARAMSAIRDNCAPLTETDDG